MTYGVDVKPEHDPHIERAEKALVTLEAAAIPGNFLVDLLPFVKHLPSWMPGAGFKRFADKARPDTLDMMNAPFSAGCSRMVRGIYFVR